MEAATRPRNMTIPISLEGGPIMGVYLDRLNQQFDEVRNGIDTVLSRATDDNREVTEAEETQINRDKARMDELQTAIEHYSSLETQGAKVAALRATVPASPATVVTGKPEADAYDIAREFPTVADYVITVHRAMALRDSDAREKLERATAHQMLADNPGLVPRPILGPVINDINVARPFI